MSTVYFHPISHVLSFEYQNRFGFPDNVTQETEHPHTHKIHFPEKSPSVPFLRLKTVTDRISLSLLILFRDTHTHSSHSCRICRVSYGRNITLLFLIISFGQFTNVFLFCFGSVSVSALSHSFQPIRTNGLAKLRLTK